MVVVVVVVVVGVVVVVVVNLCLGSLVQWQFDVGAVVWRWWW